MTGAGDGAVLVTGATGFVGRHLLEALQSGPVPRRALALVRDTAAWQAHEWARKLDRVEPLMGSVTESDAWRDSPRLEGLRGIVHLAALVQHSRRSPEAMVRTNVEGTRAMVELAAERGCRLVYVSTSGVVGCFADPESQADEDAPYCEEAIARWPYYASKLRAERMARELSEERGVELVIVRPPILLGPGDHRFRSSSHLLRLLRGKLPFVVRGGVPFADVRDVTRALVRVLERETVRPVYHLVGSEPGVVEFFAMAAELGGVPPPRFVLPFRPAWLVATAFERLGVWLRGEPFHGVPDPVVIEMASRHWGLRSRWAESELDYASRDPRETLADTIRWLRQNAEDLH